MTLASSFLSPRSSTGLVVLEPVKVNQVPGSCVIVSALPFSFFGSGAASLFEVRTEISSKSSGEMDIEI